MLILYGCTERLSFVLVLLLCIYDAVSHPERRKAVMFPILKNIP